jgi:SAM-dependent methyltransferase
MRAMSFGSVAEDYNRLRPDPPESAVDWLLPARREQIVDLAAGTGKLSRALARKSGRVIAIEPDPRMGAVLRARSPGVQVVAGVGEAIPLRTASADGLFISSAWHWMDPVIAAPEIARVLRDGGRFGLIWTSRDREAGWVQRLNNMRESYPAPAAAPKEDSPPARRRGHREMLLPDPSPFTDIEGESFTYTRTMPVDDVVEMMGTYSGLLIASDQDRAAILASFRAVLEEEFPGATQIDVPIRAVCWRATRVPRQGPQPSTASRWS